MPCLSLENCSVAIATRDGRKLGLKKQLGANLVEYGFLPPETAHQGIILYKLRVAG